jgi:hypothetical protein
MSHTASDLDGFFGTVMAMENAARDLEYKMMGVFVGHIHWKQ